MKFKIIFLVLFLCFQLAFSEINIIEDKELWITNTTHKINRNLAWSYDGEWLAVTVWNKVWILDGNTGSFLFELANGTDFAMDAAFPLNGKDKIAVCKGGSVEIWKIAGGIQKLNSYPHGQECLDVEFIDDTHVVTSGDNSAKIIDIETGETINFYDPGNEKIADSHVGLNGKIYSNDFYNKTIKIWDAQTGQLLSTFELGEHAAMISLSPDKTLIAYPGHENGGTVRVIRADTGQLIKSIHKPVDNYFDWYVVKWSPDGKYIAAAGYGGMCSEEDIHIIDYEKGEAVARLDGQIGSITSIGWSPDGSKIATSGDCFNIRTWNTSLFAGEGVCCLLPFVLALFTVAFTIFAGRN